MSAPLPSLQPIAPNSFLKPPKKRFIAASFLVALMINLIPLPQHVTIYRVDFIVLVLIYWCTFQPHRIGVFVAFCLGVVMDVADGALLGQHVSHYVIVAYVALAFRHRMLSFPLWQQTLFVAILSEVSLGAMLFFHTIFGNGAAVSPVYLIVPAAAALLWTPVSFILQYPQRNAITPVA